jgi:RNA polymerase sigma-70 factor (ECF subfamily)
MQISVEPSLLCGRSFLDEILQSERPLILRFVEARVRDRDLAADLTQECLWRASRAWRGFRGDSSVNTWLRHIALNVIRNSARNMQRELLCSALPIERVLADWLADNCLSPEATVVVRDTVRRIWKAAERVSPQQQLALKLRFIEDLELVEIAAVMDVTEGTVKVHLFRAIQSIRIALQVSVRTNKCRKFVPPRTNKVSPMKFVDLCHYGS